MLNRWKIPQTAATAPANHAIVTKAQQILAT
jgi:hypothetical protein